MSNNKHLTLDDRSFIQNSLNSGCSFRQIARYLDKDPSTISKEVRIHRVLSTTSAIGRIPNKCIKRTSCEVTGLCERPNCNRSLCRTCKHCNSICSDFQEEHCQLLLKNPYVCNGCEQKSRCVLTKYFYRALPAYNNYKQNLSSCREGISYTEEELQYVDDIISPLVRKKQSIHHIYVSQADKILCSERTLYNIIGQGVLSVRNIDLPRKVRYRQRKRNKSFKVDKSCRNGRTYQDFQAFLKEHPDTPIVQMDSVEGRKGGKVLLTIFYTQSDLMLIYLRNHNTSQTVIDIFNSLDETLGRESFKKLFPVILTDNGSEFSNPHAIEYDASGHQRTQLFYCDPSSPHQKPEIERNHELIRMILPKGTSFDDLSDDAVLLISCHINSLIRKKLNDQCPISTFSFFHGDTTLQKLCLLAIPPNEVNLSPALLTDLKDVYLHEEAIS